MWGTEMGKLKVGNGTRKIGSPRAKSFDWETKMAWTPAVPKILGLPTFRKRVKPGEKNIYNYCTAE